MRFSSQATLFILAFFSGANAIITSLTVPSTIAAGKPFAVTLGTENYIQTVKDIAVAFGISPGAGYPGSLGKAIDSEYLGPSKSNVLTPITYTMSLDPYTPAGPATLSTVIFSLIGTMDSPIMHQYNVSVTIGLFTSYTTITST